MPKKPVVDPSKKLHIDTVEKHLVEELQTEAGIKFVNNDSLVENSEENVMVEDLELGRYLHLKSKTIYYALKVVTNTTNAQDGQKMVHYVKEGGGVFSSPNFVRELSEFKEKFEKI